MHFETICRAAKTRNLSLLESVITKNSTIDEWQMGHYGWSALSQLASEATVDLGAVEFLLRRGGNLSYAIQGAAKARHVELVMKWLETCPDYDAALTGAAMGGHTELVTQLLELSKRQETNTTDINCAILGAAIGGHTDLVMQLLKGPYTNVYGQGANIDRAFFGAAISGNIALIEQLLKLGTSPSMMLKGAAVGGHISLLIKLLQTETSLSIPLQDTEHTIDALIHLCPPEELIPICQFAGLGGHTNFVLQCLQSLDDCRSATIKYAAQGGHIELLMKLFEGNVVTDDLQTDGFANAINGAFQGGHLLDTSISRLAFFTRFSADKIPLMIERFRDLLFFSSTTTQPISEDEKPRIEMMSKLIHQHAFSFSEALVKTEPKYRELRMDKSLTFFNENRVDRTSLLNFLVADIQMVILLFLVNSDMPISLSLFEIKRLLAFEIQNTTRSQTSLASLASASQSDKDDSLELAKADDTGKSFNA